MSLESVPVTKASDIILPDSAVSNVWNGLCFLLLCYAGLTGPYFLAFSNGMRTAYVVADVLLLLVHWIDMYLRLNLLAMVKVRHSCNL